MKPQMLPAFGLPCQRCAQPAREVEIYPGGRRIHHIDLGLRSCDLPPQNTERSDR